ncbi:helix-turn-helix transcriptional regulator [Roseibium sp. SCP14]|uniref:helix-turn-helix transcriptional regulator n=1 Tax=Roseibium sp. SCP14 TaxID=3141375 RepID=UPI00333A6957
MVMDRSDLLGKLYTSALLDGGLSGVLSDLAIIYPELPITYQAQCVYETQVYDCAMFNHGSDAEIHLSQAQSANPFPPIALKCDVSDVAITEHFIRPQDVEKTDFYDEYLKHHREINRAFGIILHRHGADSAFVAANLPRTMKKREERHVLELFRFLRPHLQGAFNLILEVAKRKSTLTNPTFWLDQIPTSACVVSPDGKVQHFNGRAARMFQLARNLYMDKMVRLSARKADTHKALHNALQKASMSSTAVGPVPLVPGRQGGPFAFILPIHEREQIHPGLAPFIAPTLPLLVTIFDPDEAPKKSERILAAALGLSERESLLVQELILGASLREASNNLQISYNTARNQLASATSKTGSHSQSDIIRRGTQILARLGDASLGSGQSEP